MPRQRINHKGETNEVPEDIPDRLKRFHETSGLSWSEIALRIGTYRYTVWRWKEGRTRPIHHYWQALLELAEDLGRVRLLPSKGAGPETQKGQHTWTCEPSIPAPAVVLVRLPRQPAGKLPPVLSVIQ